MFTSRLSNTMVSKTSTSSTVLRSFIQSTQRFSSKQARKSSQKFSTKTISKNSTTTTSKNSTTTTSRNNFTTTKNTPKNTKNTALLSSRRTNSTQQQQPESIPPQQPHRPETNDEMYARLKAQNISEQQELTRQILTHGAKPIKKSSPWTSFVFVNLVLTLPAGFITWRMYNDPVWIKLTIRKVKRLWILFRNPKYRPIFDISNGKPLSEAISSTLALECNLTQVVINDDDDDETKLAKEALNEAKMKSNILAAQKILYKEINKVFEYITWLDDFRGDLDDIMSIPGFENNREAEMRGRTMKANKAEVESFIQKLIVSLIDSVGRTEESHLLDPNNIKEEFRPKMQAMLNEQERLKIIDSYKVQAYKSAKVAREKKSHHTGIVLTPRIHKDADGNAVNSEGLKVDENAERESTLFDGSDNAVLSESFYPKTNDNMTDEQRKVDSVMQLGLHRGERSLAELGEKHADQEEKIERMSSPDWESKRVVPRPLDIKPIDKYSDYELHLAFFMSLQTACIGIQTVGLILEMVMEELDSQKKVILERKERFAKQEHQREVLNNRRAKSLKDGNYFTDNSLPSDQGNGEDQVSRFDFVFDFEELLKLVDKSVLNDVNNILLYKLDAFWDRNSHYVHDRDSLVKALELYPQATRGIEKSSGLTKAQIYSLPEERIWIGRLISFPSAIVQGTRNLTEEMHEKRYFSDLKQDEMTFLSKEFIHFPSNTSNAV